MTAHAPGHWRVGDAGHTIFGPNLGEPSPEIIATVKHKRNAPILAAAPALAEALAGILRLFTANPENAKLSAAEKAQIVKKLELDAREALALAGLAD